MATELLKTGEFAVFCPFLDYQFGLQEPLVMDVYKLNSLAFVSDCDVLLGTPGWEVSNGTLAEIEEAKQFNIPFFDSIQNLMTWKKTQFDPAPSDESYTIWAGLVQPCQSTTNQTQEV